MHYINSLLVYPRGSSDARVLAVVVCLNKLLSLSVCLSHAGIVSQELIRRWDSERELFYDDIAHVEAYFRIPKRELTSFYKLNDS